MAVSSLTSSKYQCWTWSSTRIEIQPDSVIHNRIRSGLDIGKTLPDQIWISKLRWSLQSNAQSEGSFRLKTGLDQLFGSITGLDYTMKILERISITKISNPFNTTKYWDIGKNHLGWTHLRPTACCRLSQNQNEFIDVFTTVHKISNLTAISRQLWSSSWF